jgi:DNA-binding GntR family transcriptional regulator
LLSNLLIDNEKHEGFIFFKRLRLVEDLPKFIKEPLLEGSLFRTLIIKYQIDVHSMIYEVRAVTADKETSNLLKIKQNSLFCIF